MGIDAVGRRVSALVLAVGVACTALPLAAQDLTASDTLISARPVLTPGELRKAVLDMPRVALRLGGVQDIGEIRGAVMNARGQPVPGQQVELRRPPSAGRGRLVTTTDANGGFVYRGLSAGRYEVELRDDDGVVATSGPVELSDRRMRVSDVVIALPVPLRELPRPLPRVTSEYLLAGASVTRSFERLVSVLRPGHEVIVEDDAGHRTRGRVVSASSRGLTLAVCWWWSSCRPGFLRPRPYAGTRDFARGSVAAVELVDSTRNGVLIGAAVGAALMFGLVQANREELARSNLGPVNYVVYATLSFAPSIAIGQFIDFLNNDPLFERLPGPSRARVAPLVHRDAIGISVQLGF